DSRLGLNMPPRVTSARIDRASGKTRRRKPSSIDWRALGCMPTTLRELPSSAMMTEALGLGIATTPSPGFSNRVVGPRWACTRISSAATGIGARQANGSARPAATCRQIVRIKATSGTFVLRHREGPSGGLNRGLAHRHTPTGDYALTTTTAGLLT